MRILGVGVLIFFLVSCSSEEQIDLRTRAEKSALLVDVYVVEAGNWQNTVQSTGTFLPLKQVELKSEVNGKVTSISFNEGDQVKKGQLLVQVDDQVLQAQKVQLEVEIKWLEKQHERDLKLLQSEAISEQEFENNFSSLESKKAALKGVKSQINLTKIRAPFDGTIGLSDLQKGSYMNAGDLITDITMDKILKLEFAVPEFFAHTVEKGDEVLFTLMGSLDTLKAEVYTTDSKIDPDSRMLNVRAYYANEGTKVLPGTFTQVTLELKSEVSGLKVPSESIEPQLSGEQVYVVENGKVTVKSIKTGKRNERYVQVLGGLEKNDTVLVSGLLSARPGTEVEIKKVINR